MTRETSELVEAVLIGLSRPEPPTPVDAEAHRALAELRERLEAETQLPRVTCVAFASDGTPLGTVKLLGDPEAVQAVVQHLDAAEHFADPVR